MNVNLEEGPQTIDATSAEVVRSKVKAESNEKVTVEEFKISGDALVARVRDLIHQGNIRRIILKHENGQTLIEIPLTVGVIGGTVGAVFFPILAAVGVIGAMVARLTVVIERRELGSSHEEDTE